MPAREQTTAGKSVRVISDISKDLGGILPEFEKYECIVILSKWNTGKTTSATRMVCEYFGEEKTEYITLTNQTKNSEHSCRLTTLKFGEVPDNKIVIFDELHSDSNIQITKINNYIRLLTQKNKLVILSNPYGAGGDTMHEIELFSKQEKAILPQNTLFVFVTNKT